MEKTVGREDLSSSPIQSLDDQRLTEYELPVSPLSQESIPDQDLENHKNELLLRLLGKNYQSFDTRNQTDPK